MRLRHLVLFGFLCLASTKYVYGEVSGTVVTRTKRSTSDESSSSSESSEESVERERQRKQKHTTQIKMKIQQDKNKRLDFYLRQRQRIINDRNRISRQNFQNILRHNQELERKKYEAQIKQERNRIQQINIRKLIHTVHLHKQHAEKQKVINLNRNTWVKKEQQRRLHEISRQKYEEHRIFQEKIKELQKRKQQEKSKKEDEIKAARKAYLQNILNQKTIVQGRQKNEEKMVTLKRRLQSQWDENRHKKDENKQQTRTYEEIEKDLLERKQEENRRRLQQQLQEEKKRLHERLHREIIKENEQPQNKLRKIKDNRAEHLLPCDKTYSLGFNQRNPRNWGKPISLGSTLTLPRNFLSTSKAFPYNLNSKPKSDIPSNSVVASCWSKVATATPNTPYNLPNKHPQYSTYHTPLEYHNPRTTVGFDKGNNNKVNPKNWPDISLPINDMDSSTDPKDKNKYPSSSTCGAKNNNENWNNAAPSNSDKDLIANTESSFTYGPLSDDYQDWPLDNSPKDDTYADSNVESSSINSEPGASPNSANNNWADDSSTSKEDATTGTYSGPGTSYAASTDRNTYGKNGATGWTDNATLYGDDRSSKASTYADSDNEGPANDWAHGLSTSKKYATTGAYSGAGSSPVVSTSSNTYGEIGTTGWPDNASSLGDGPTNDNEDWSNATPSQASTYPDANNKGVSTTGAPDASSDDAANDWADGSSTSEADDKTGAYSGASTSYAASTDGNTYGQNGATGWPDKSSSADDRPTIGISVNSGSTATPSPSSNDNQDWSEGASQGSTYPDSNNEGSSTTCAPDASTDGAANDWADGSSTSKGGATTGAYSGTGTSYAATTDENAYGQNGATRWPDNSSSADDRPTIGISVNLGSTATPSPSSGDNQDWPNGASSQASPYPDSNNEGSSTTCAPDASTDGAANDWADGSSTSEADDTTGAYSGASTSYAASTDENTYGQNGATGWPDKSSSADDRPTIGISVNLGSTATPSPSSNDNQDWSEGASQGSTYPDSNNEGSSTTCAPDASTDGTANDWADGSSTSKGGATTGAYSGTGTSYAATTDENAYGQNGATGWTNDATLSGDDSSTIGTNRSSKASTYADSDNEGPPTTCAPDALSDGTTNDWADGKDATSDAYSSAGSSSTTSVDQNTYGQNDARGWPDSTSSNGGSFATSSSNGASTDSTSGSNNFDGATTGTSANAWSTATSTTSNDDNQDWNGGVSPKANTYADSNSGGSYTTSVSGWTDGALTSAGDTTGAHSGADSTSTASTNKNDATEWADSA